MVIIFSKLFVVVIAFLALFSTRKMRMTVTKICLILFDVAYILPLLIEIVLGYADSSYRIFVVAQRDFITEIVYVAFTIIVQFVFIFFMIRTDRDNKGRFVTFKESILVFRNKIEGRWFIPVVCVSAVLITIFLIIISPNPRIYLSLGTFAMRTTETTIQDTEYYLKVLRNTKFVILVCVVLLKLYDKKDNVFFYIVRLIGMIIVIIIDGKRTLFTFGVLIILGIDYLAKGGFKKIWLKVLLYAGAIIAFFVMYSYITGKYEYNTNWYAVINEYFFKSNSVKVALYSWLHPGQLQILDYPGQTFLYDIFYYIPRSVWANKPMTYPDYYTAAVLGHGKLINYGWYFQTNLYSEFIANIGFWGMAAAPIYVAILSRFIDKGRSAITNAIGMVFLIEIQLFEYSDMLKIVFAVWVLLWIKDNLPIKLKFKM